MKKKKAFQQLKVPPTSRRLSIRQERHHSEHKRHQSWDFPGGTVVGSPPANAGDTGSSPGPGRSHMPPSN